MTLESTQWIALLTRFLWICFTVGALVLITYPPTRIQIAIRHKRVLQALGAVWIVFQFSLAITLRNVNWITREELLIPIRILELAFVIVLIIWSIISLKNSITLR